MANGQWPTSNRIPMTNYQWKTNSQNRDEEESEFVPRKKREGFCPASRVLPSEPPHSAGKDLNNPFRYPDVERGRLSRSRVRVRVRIRSDDAQGVVTAFGGMP